MRAAPTMLTGLLALTITMLALPCSPASAQSRKPAIEQDDTRDIIITRDDRYRRLTTMVRIGGSGPYRFLVDTGAQNTVVSDALAARLTLPASRPATVIGVAGRMVAPTVTIDGLVLGRHSFNHLTAPVLAAADIGADGIVGLDTLQDQRILIDFPHALIVVGDAADEGGDRGFDIVVRARRRSGQLIITTARIDGIAVDVVLDTGADSTIGNRALQRAFQRRPHETMTIDSVTGQSLPVDVLVARTMTLGPLELRNVPIACADAPPFALLKLDRRPAILLGMSELRAFKRVAIDFRRRKVLFDTVATGEPRLRVVH